MQHYGGTLSSLSLTSLYKFQTAIIRLILDSALTSLFSRNSIQICQCEYSQAHCTQTNSILQKLLSISFSKSGEGFVLVCVGIKGVSQDTVGICTFNK